MIAYLRGRLHTIRDNAAIIDVNGVGYRVFLSSTHLSTLPTFGAQVEVDIVTIKREDALHLYGFESKLQRLIFKHLIAISGIGPKQAMQILSHSQPQDLLQAITNTDVTYLQGLKGIGRKTAEKIILELKGPVNKLIEDDSVAIPASFAKPLQRDLITALGQLGYRRAQIDEAIAHLPNINELSLEEAIRESLRWLGGSKTQPQRFYTTEENA